MIFHVFCFSFGWQDYCQNDNDVVMLAKEWVSSEALSQQPLLVLPFDYLQRVQGVCVEAQPRKTLGTRECDEPFGL